MLAALVDNNSSPHSGICGALQIIFLTRRQTIDKPILNIQSTWTGHKHSCVFDTVNCAFAFLFYTPPAPPPPLLECKPRRVRYEQRHVFFRSVVGCAMSKPSTSITCGSLTDYNIASICLWGQNVIPRFPTSHHHTPLQKLQHRIY